LKKKRVFCVGRPRRNIEKKRNRSRKVASKEKELLENGGLGEEEMERGEERVGCGDRRLV
jgi:hypothetical protein